jgi:flagellar hook protein FlgE
MNVSSVSGIQNLTRVFDRAAATVSAASADTAAASGSGPDLVDGMVGMNLAASGIKANIAVLRTSDEMLGSLLDMRA